MRTTIALLAALTTATLTLAQTAPQAAATSKPAPPALGPIISYQYWPTQYIQFVTGPELPYTMFILEADTTGKQPLYHAILTGKDGKRTHYSNTDALTLQYKAQGEPSYKVDFAVEADESEKVGAVTTARFTAHDEKPVEFRFVQGSDISEQAAGLQPVPDAPIPVFAYRELGAVAGEGTALKIGETVSTAEMWKEISKPPYFVGYRGAETQSAHQIIFYKGTQTWTVAKYPAALTTGNTWELDSDRGDHLSLRIDRADGTHFTLTGTDRFQPAIRIVVEATRTATDGTDSFATDRVLFMPAAKGGEKHAAALTFTPALNATATQSTMDLGVGKKKSIATATLTLSGDTATRTAEVKFTAPAWAATKTLTEESKLTGDTMTLSAK